MTLVWVVTIPARAVPEFFFSETEAKKRIEQSIALNLPCCETSY